MILVVGLGNPGSRYDNTRHNIGFRVVTRLADELSISLGTKKFKAVLGEGRALDERLILALPQTYMNLSGEAVVQICGFYKIPMCDVVVVHDDLDLPLGRLRIRRGGSPGGHNGIRSIIDLCGTGDFTRVKIGIGRPPPGMEVVDYVLAKCPGDVERELGEQAKIAADAVQAIIKDGLDKAMCAFNGAKSSSRTSGDKSE